MAYTFDRTRRPEAAELYDAADQAACDALISAIHAARGRPSPQVKAAIFRRHDRRCEVIDRTGK